AGAFVNSLNTTTPLAFSFGSALYGFFTPTSVLQNSLISGISRTLQWDGTFAPGAAFFPPGYKPTPGILTLTINQARIGNLSVLSASATLATGADVPEPSTIVMLVSMVVPLGAWGYRRQSVSRRRVCRT